MIFGRLPLDQADGAVLAHGLTVGDRRLKKGHRLTADDLAKLAVQGAETVLAARIEDGEVDEDRAAGALAEALSGRGCRINAAFTGRCNIYAEQDGVMVLDPTAIDDVNAVDEALTVATLRPFEAVEAGQMLATVKVIPFAVEKAPLARASAVAPGAISVRAFVGKRIAIISTHLPETRESVLEKGEELMRRRARRTGGDVVLATRVAHHEDAVQTALEKATTEDADIAVIFSASAITDRRDVVPAGLIQAGGEIVHYGMPVDPGNLLLLGALGDMQVIGAPGCARSPRENGFDWVFQRLSADLPVDAGDIMSMGVGGLLLDTGQRGAPRDRDRDGAGAQRMPRVAAVLLAAGQSRRMGAANKLLAPVDGKPMVRHALDAIAASDAATTIVVTGHEPDAVKKALAETDTRFVHNPLYRDGLSTSLGAGLLAVPAECDAAVVCLGDMPLISPQVIDRLIAAYNPVEGRAICVPTRNGKRGNPVLFDRRFFGDALQIGGDVGAKHLIGDHEDLVVEVPMDDDSIFTDVDTPEALAQLS